MTGGKAEIPAKGFRYSAAGIPPKTFDVLLYPYPSPRPPSVSAEYLTPDAASGDVIALKATIGKNTDYIFAAENGPAEIRSADGGIQINAEILLIRIADGGPPRVSGKNVRKVVLFGETLFPKMGLGPLTSRAGQLFGQFLKGLSGLP